MATSRLITARLPRVLDDVAASQQLAHTFLRGDAPFERRLADAS